MRKVEACVLRPPFLEVGQGHAFYKPTPEKHEQARNIPADCKTEFPLIVAAQERDRLARAALAIAQEPPAAPTPETFSQALARDAFKTCNRVAAWRRSGYALRERQLFRQPIRVKYKLL
jgi:hypothetical protein